MSGHQFKVWSIPLPSKQQVEAACDLYEQHAARGLEPNAIAKLTGLTPGTVCVIRRWSLERAAGGPITI